MPIRLTIDRDRARVRTRAEGVVTFDEIVAHLDRKAELHGTGYAELFDARQARIDITPGQIRALVGRVDATRRGEPLGPTAFVVTNDASFGMARVYEILAEDRGMAVGVFRTLDEAERWLDEAAPARGGNPGA